MERETLFTIYRKSIENTKKVRMNIDELSEEEFVSTYSSDPFFQ
jgi:hypothetical protein